MGVEDGDVEGDVADTAINILLPLFRVVKHLHDLGTGKARVLKPVLALATDHDNRFCLAPDQRLVQLETGERHPLPLEVAVVKRVEQDPAVILVGPDLGGKVARPGFVPVVDYIQVAGRKAQ